MGEEIVLKGSAASVWNCLQMQCEASQRNKVLRCKPLGWVESSSRQDMRYGQQKTRNCLWPKVSKCGRRVADVEGTGVA